MDGLRLTAGTDPGRHVHESVGRVAGDVIFTGTPAGAGARFAPPRWLRPGDVVEVTVPEIGTLRNPIEDEALEGPEV